MEPFAEGVVELEARTKDEALVELVEAVGTSDAVEDPEALLTAVRERERLLSTGIGLGIAIPHARIASVKEIDQDVVGLHRAGDHRGVAVVAVVRGGLLEVGQPGLGVPIVAPVVQGALRGEGLPQQVG